MVIWEKLRSCGFTLLTIAWIDQWKCCHLSKTWKINLIYFRSRFTHIDTFSGAPNKWITYILTISPNGHLRKEKLRSSVSSKWEKLRSCAFTLLTIVWIDQWKCYHLSKIWKINLFRITLLFIYLFIFTWWVTLFCLFIRTSFESEKRKKKF